MPEVQSLRSHLLAELCDLLDAEQEIANVLPQLASGATTRRHFALPFNIIWAKRRPTSIASSRPSRCWENRLSQNVARAFGDCSAKGML